MTPTKALGRMPAVFVGHGSPMNALPGSIYGEGWSALGRRLPRPKAILAVSAHWETRGVTAFTSQAQPPTIHDFRGFPQTLFDMQYPAPGAPELLNRVNELVPTPVVASDRWGFDHGTWSVLSHVFPNADIPTAQLSLDMSQGPMAHYELAKALRPLRDEGVLIFGSGDIVHNLRTLRPGPPHDWAARFEARIQAALIASDIETVARIDADDDARQAAPDHEHYFPILYVAAQRDEGEKLEFFNQGIDMGSISMTSFVVGEF